MAKKTRAPRMTLQQADAHQRKHGFKPLVEYETARVPVTAGKISTMKKVKGKLRNVTPPTMNRTEREFSMLLEARKRVGEIGEWRFGAVRLLWGGGMHYKGDFAVQPLAEAERQRITIIEVKGDKIFERDIVRFKGCRNEWQHWFDFEFHQRRKDGTWTQLL